MNKTHLIGRTTADIELKKNSNDKDYCRFTLAVNRDFKKEDGTQDADFISCVAWGKTAEVMSKFVKKGHKVAISGRIQTGKYENEKGDTVYTTDVIVNDLEFLEKKPERPEPEDLTPNNAPQPSQDEYHNDVDISDDDLPF